MRLAGVQRLHIAEAGAPRRKEEVAVQHADFLQSLQAVHRKAGAGHQYIAHPRLRQRGKGLVRVRLEPCRRAKAGLIGEPPGVLPQAQPLRQRGGRGLALGRIGVASVRLGLGNAMEGEDQKRPAPPVVPGAADGVGKGVQVEGVVMVVAHQPPANLRALAHGRLHLVLYGAGGGPGELREEGQKGQLPDALCRQPRHRPLDGGRAIGHRHLHPSAALPGPPRQRCGDVADGPLPPAPNKPVLRHQPPRPGVQYDQVQQGQPEPARQIHHPRVRQELPQIAPNGARLRRIRCPQVHDNCRLHAPFALSRQSQPPPLAPSARSATP